MSKTTRELVPSLGRFQAWSIVIGGIVGGGIFLKPATMAQALPSPLLILLTWVVAGLLSLAGALTYGELASLYPQAGGEYVYLTNAYGSAIAFSYGWTQMAVAQTASIAALATQAIIFLSVVVPIRGSVQFFSVQLFNTSWTFAPSTAQLLAILFIASLSGINLLKISLSSRLQTLWTAGTLLCIVVVIIAIALGPKDSPPTNWLGGFKKLDGFSPSLYLSPLLAALWMYDGWNNLAMIASEVKNSRRVIPRALIMGVITVIAIYTSANAAFLSKLSVIELARARSDLWPNELPVATKALLGTYGKGAVAFVALVIFLSTGACLSTVITASARIPYAMALDGVFFRCFSRLNRFQVPARTIICQAILASVYVLSATYDQLTDLVVFTLWIFYALSVSSVFVFRRRSQTSGLYRTVGYPFVPVFFVVAALLMFVSNVLIHPASVVFVLILMFIGLPIYVAHSALWSRRGA